MSTIFSRYPRSLYEWLKSDDKVLLSALKDGKTVQEAAEDLQREPVTVLNRLNALDICPFTTGSEEWAEVMRLALAEVPLQFVVSWCTASPDRLPFEMFIAFATSDLEKEFALARQLNVIVANADAVEDLTWLINQPDEVQAGYPAACDALVEAFEVITPSTLKRQTTGEKAPPLARNWAQHEVASSHTRGTRRAWKSKTRTGSKTYYKRSRRKSTT